MECQAVCSGKSKNFFIPPGKSVKGSFVEGLQIASSGSRVKIRLAGQERNLDKESGILVIFAGKQAGDGDHGAIGGIMESSQPVFFCFGGDQFHFLLEGGFPVDGDRDQTARFPLYDADLGQIHRQQGGHVPVVGAQGGADCLQVGNAQVKLRDLVFQQAF